MGKTITKIIIGIIEKKAVIDPPNNPPLETNIGPRKKITKIIATIVPAGFFFLPSTCTSTMQY